MAENKELTELQALEEKNDLFKNRPPGLWNEPESLEKEHFLRTSADPFRVYKDGRVKKLYDFIMKFGKVLMTFEEDKWKNLVNQTIRVFQSMSEREILS